MIIKADKLEDVFLVCTERRWPIGKSLRDKEELIQKKNEIENKNLASHGMPVIGSIIDKYRLDDVLGKGGFSTVYRATHLTMKKTVAIKIMDREMIKKHPDIAEMLCEEARFLASIEHPNIVRIMDVTKTNMNVYIVMEYVRGKSMKEAIDQLRKLTPIEAFLIAKQVAIGLRAAFKRNIIHRDIKPANILIGDDDMVKLVDLGVAKVSGATESNKDHIKGTPSYLAPENVTDPEKADHRVDFYSLGVTLYQAITGNLPFEGRSTAEIIEAHIHSIIPNPCHAVNNLPVECGDFIMRLMDKDPGNRPADHDELINLITQCIAELETVKMGKTSRFIRRIGKLLG